MNKLDQLIKSCAKNDRKAQGEIYQLFSGKLYGVCLKYSKNEQQAKDNLHDAFIKIFEKIGSFRFKGSFEGWIKRITVNLIMQTYRDKKVIHLSHENIPEVEQEEVYQEKVDLKELLSHIQSLPNQYRLVFNLYVLDGYSHKEIATHLDISIGTSKSNLSRARMLLKTRLEKKLNKKLA